MNDFGQFQANSVILNSIIICKLQKYDGWVLIRGWASIRMNTVVV